MKSSPRALTAAPSEAQRAAYVAWLLRIDPYNIFSVGPECNPEADQHLVDSILAELEKHRKQASNSHDPSPRAVWFRQTLDHCTSVMSGKVNPADNGWYENRRGYRRGVYLFQEGAE